MRTKGLTPQETERMLSNDSGILGLCGKTDLKSLLDELAGNLAEDTGAKETGAEDTGVKETRVKETGAKETGAKETTVKETGLAKTTDLLQETWESYVYRLVTQAGAMTFAMGGLDRIVFSGGAGENSAELRAAFINKLQFMHAELDQEKNRDKALQEKERKKFGYADITGNSKIRIFIGYAEEEKAMAMTAKTMMKSGGG
jgi:acetate kinase